MFYSLFLGVLLVLIPGLIIAIQSFKEKPNNFLSLYMFLVFLVGISYLK